MIKFLLICPTWALEKILILKIYYTFLKRSSKMLILNCRLTQPRSKGMKGVLKKLLEIMKSTLASGENLMISGFGKFQVGLVLTSAAVGASHRACPDKGNHRGIAPTKNGP